MNARISEFAGWVEQALFLRSASDYFGPLLEIFDPEREASRVPSSEEAEAEGVARFVPAGEKTLLEQAEEKGLNPRFGCRRGICHRCTCTKTSGKVIDTRTGEESSDGVEEIQICVSRPVGEVALQIQTADTPK